MGVAAESLWQIFCLDADHFRKTRMKQLMILGAMFGFLIGIGFGLAFESSWPTSLWRACAAAYASGMLMRWWGRIWVKSLHQAQNEQMTSGPRPELPVAARTKQ